jgi:hypothetical protein
MATKTLTKEQWQKVDTEFKINAWTTIAKFNIDGYKVSIVQELIGRKLQILCYVNGEFKGLWLNRESPHEIGIRFFPYGLKPLYSKETKKHIQSIYTSAKRLKERFPDFDNKVRIYRWTFRNIAEVKRIFEAHNDSIELLELS